MDSLHICISCRYHAEQRSLDGKRGGQILFEKVEPKIDAVGLKLQLMPVECLSACRSFCALAFTGPRKMTMVFGRIDSAYDPDASVDALLHYARDYCASPDGFILRSQRPLFLQDKLIARVPPAESLPKS